MKDKNHRDIAAKKDVTEAKAGMKLPTAINAYSMLMLAETWKHKDDHINAPISGVVGTFIIP